MKKLIGVFLAIFGLGLHLIVVLYYEMFSLKVDITQNETLYPDFIWILNTLYIGILFFAFAQYTNIKKIVTYLGTISYVILSLLNGFINLTTYDVFWDDGHVLVYLTNKIGEITNSVLNVLMLKFSTIRQMTYTYVNFYTSAFDE